MNQKDVEAALVGIIQEIQDSSGLECPPLDGTVVPSEEVPEFDSKVWIAATTMLATKLDVEIPDNVNIFADKDNKAPLNLSDISSTVCEVAIVKDASDQVA